MFFTEFDSGAITKGRVKRLSNVLGYDYVVEFTDDGEYHVELDHLARRNPTRHKKPAHTPAEVSEVLSVKAAINPPENSPPKRHDAPKEPQGTAPPSKTHAAAALLRSSTSVFVCYMPFHKEGYDVCPPEDGDAEFSHMSHLPEKVQGKKPTQVKGGALFRGNNRKHARTPKGPA